MSITIDKVRAFFRDYPQENMKYLEEYFKDTEIQMAIDLAKDKAVKMPPILDTMTADQVPDYIMLEGAAAMLIQIKLNNLAINYTQGVTEHGVSLGIGEEYGVLQNLGQMYDQRFTETLYRFKKAFDFRNSTATIRSPYGRYYGHTRVRGSRYYGDLYE